MTQLFIQIFCYVNIIRLFVVNDDVKSHKNNCPLYTTWKNIRYNLTILN